MKQLFPIYIAIIAMTIVLIVTLSKNSKSWQELTQREKNIKIIILTSGLALLLLGILALISY